MGRSRRLVVDADNSWIFRGYYDTVIPQGSTPSVSHPGGDYIVLSYDQSGDDQAGLSPALYTSLFQGSTTITIWGKGLISLGNPTADQISFMDSATAQTDLGLFPGAFVHAGYRDPVGEIFVGVRNSYTEIAFPGVTFTFYGDLIQISNSAGVIDLGTGVRLTSADANGQFYRLAGLLQRGGTTVDDTITGTAAPQTIHGYEGQDDRRHRCRPAVRRRRQRYDQGRLRRHCRWRRRQ